MIITTLVLIDKEWKTCKEEQANALRTVPTNKKKYFCAVYDYAGKADPSKGFRNPKIKLGVATQFLEIIKQLLF